MAAGERILIIDDEREIGDIIKSYLLKEGFEPIWVPNGKKALEAINTDRPELIILDFMLPDIEGPELCLNIRKITNAPVLFLSCRSEEIDKIVSLSSGGDDYITKPFLPGELIARIKANLRRSRSDIRETEENIQIIAGNLKVDTLMHNVFVNGELINLTSKEFDILSLLIQNPKRIYSAEQLFKIVWNTTSLNNDSNTVAVHIRALRMKIEEKDPETKYIINMRSVGYKFNHNIINE